MTVVPAVGELMRAVGEIPAVFFERAGSKLHIALGQRRIHLTGGGIFGEVSGR